MIEQTLIELKRKIENAKTEVAELQGRKKLLEEQMKTQWKCKNITEIKGLLSQKQQEETTLNKKINTLSKEIEEKYNV